MNITWKEFGLFLTRLKNLPVSKSITLGNNGGFCVSTGCDIESWVYYPERVKNIEDVKRAVNFFKKEKISFMWPLYDGGEKILEDAGLIYAGSLTGMIYRNNNNLYQQHVELGSEDLDYREWAKTAWHAFGGGYDDVPENYFALVEAFHNAPGFHLMSQNNADTTKKNYWATVMLSDGVNATGIYYFATIPEMRRMGVAKSFMKFISQYRNNQPLLLQSTPAGLPFYKNFGFEELCKIPVYSDVSDVF